ncbi:hypothetical protein M501DRAFT_1043300 [Patellaria atrata CBS 101060]|uniref:SET domain-containing protein n=1 Tax=Patellaria atrata CBS 101060 TaxID=1346257 RepID=A0A9P4SH36_9PEZI|nr:hypothetical protein M501DRAFT_1043300 [Patellaria atrata CBS 101060]
MSKDAELDGEEERPYEDTADRQKEVSRVAPAVEGQKPPNKPSREEILSSHATNCKALAESPEAYVIRQYFLPKAYPPSTVPLKELEPVKQLIHVGDLTLETHHRGKVVFGKVISSPYRSTGVIVVIEDEEGDVEKLSIYNRDDTTLDCFIAENDFIAIKEPFYKYNGDEDYAIRVDHPSDLLILEEGSSFIPEKLRKPDQNLSRTASDDKQAGDKAYLAKQYFRALECYSQAISRASSEDKAFRSDVYRKRAGVNLLLQRFDATESDALASVFGDGTADAKAHHLAGRAAYELEEYERGKKHFEAASKLNPKNSSFKKDLQRSNSRLAEAEGGSYDFKAMSSTLTNRNVHLDNATYSADVKVGITEYYGRGTFAARDIKAGELVLCEKAFYLPNTYSANDESERVLFNVNNGRVFPASSAALLRGLIRKLYNNPSLNADFLALDAGNYPRSGKEGILIDGVPVIDIFLIESIRVTNCFNAPLHSLTVIHNLFSKSTAGLTTALWPRSAFLNHSCTPNTARAFLGSHQLVRATRDIPAGEELTHQYVSPGPDWSQRQKVYADSWGFECGCTLCLAEKSDGPTLRGKRDQLFQTIKSVVMRKGGGLSASNAPSNPLHATGTGADTAGSLSSFIPTSTIRSVERLTTQLALLYPSPKFDALPRLCLVHPSIWLCDAWRAHRHPAKTLKYALEVLRNFGHTDVERGRGLDLRKSKGMINIETVRALRFAGEALRALGREAEAVRAEGEARRGWGVCVGWEGGWKEWRRG